MSESGVSRNYAANHRFIITILIWLPEVLASIPYVAIRIVDQVQILVVGKNVLPFSSGNPGADKLQRLFITPIPEIDVDFFNWGLSFAVIRVWRCTGVSFSIFFLLRSSRAQKNLDHGWVAI